MAEPPYVMRQFTIDRVGQLWPAVWTNVPPSSMVHYGGSVTNVTFEVDPFFRANRKRYEAAMEKGGAYPLAFQHPPYPDYTGYSIRRWDTSDGLPSNHVRAVHQTADGFLWVATNHGLARFDGREFVSFERANVPAMELVGANCLTLAEDESSQTLWVGTAGGVLRYDGDEFEVFDPDGELTGDRIQALVFSPDSRLWIGTRSQGLYVWDGHALSRVAASDGGYYDEVTSLGLNESGVLGIAGAHGVDLLTLADARSKRVSTSFTYGVYPDRNGRLWFSELNGTYYLEGGNLSRVLTEKSNGVELGTVRGIVRSQQGETLGIEQGSQLLLRHSDLGHWESLSVGGLPVDDTFVCAIADREGGTWLGMHRSGVVQLNPQPVTMFSVSFPERMDDVKTVAQGADGGLWMATGAGFIRWRGRDLLCLLTDPRSSITKLILPTRNGHRGDIEIEDGRTVAFPTELGHWRFFDENKAMQIELGKTQCSYLDPVAGRWVGGAKGLFRVTPEWQRYYTTENGLSSNDIRSLVKDEQGVMWVGTFDGGLNRLVEEQFSSITTSDGLSDNTVWSLNADLVNTLWVGTGEGLNRVVDGKVFAFDRQHGMPEGRVYSLLTDNHGYLWLGMPGGLVRVRMSDLNAIVDGRKQRTYSRRFDERAGLRSGTVNGEVQPCAWKCADGRLLFATPKGVAIVEPDRIPTQRELGRGLRLEHFVVDGEEMLAPSPLGRKAGLLDSFHLDAGRGRIVQIHYSKFTFDENDDTRFAFRLKGYETEWHDAGTETIARYQQLPPGHYRFSVDTQLRDGRRSGNAVSVAFSIAPFFYQTSYFYGVTGASMVALIFLVHQWRLRAQKRSGRRERELALEAERRRIARDAHDQLGSNLSRMILSLRRMETGSESSQVVASMRKGLEAASSQVRDLIWTVDPKSDRTESVVDFLVDYAEGWAGDTGIKLDVVWAETLGDGFVAGKTRHHLVTGFKEALNNVGRHAMASSVQIEFSVSEKYLAVRVQDDGRGVVSDKPDDTKREGHGLRNMRQRMDEIGGFLEWSTVSGSGFELRLCVPIEEKLKS